MQLSRRGLILGGSALLAGCSSAARMIELSDPLTPPATLSADLAPISSGALELPAQPVSFLDPQQIIRPELKARALAALDTHDIAVRDRLYVVDFKKFSGEPRLYELDLHNGQVKALLTAHGRGSDPEHVGVPRMFSNTPDSYASSIGAYRTAGASEGRLNGPNVLLDGLDATNSNARDRAIIVHGADYCDPSFLAREGKLGRSYGCFSTSHADLPYVRERMGSGRLLFAEAA
jgi:hypothetical protein